jgi:hypothetical protein
MMRRGVPAVSCSSPSRARGTVSRTLTVFSRARVEWSATLGRRFFDSSRPAVEAEAPDTTREANP